MSKADKIQAFLESVASKKYPLADVKAQLKAIVKGKETMLSFNKVQQAKLKEKGIKPSITINKTTAQFVLALLTENYCFNSDDVIKPLKSALENAPKKHAVVNNIWEVDDLYAVLLALLGDERIDYVQAAWNNMPTRAYQTGWSRRSFRAPNCPKLYLDAQLTMLGDSLPIAPEYYRDVYYNLNLTNALRVNNHLHDVGVHPYVWAEMIDSGHADFLQVCEDIVYNNDDIGSVSQGLIKALLSSRSENAWKLVEQLLLAAQRQEGLRQTVLECLDESSLEAIPYFINVILENKLSRFSSVVRGLDVWAGLGWEAEKQRTVDVFLKHGLDFFQHPEKIAKAVKSTNNTEVYMALWVQGCLDIEKTIPYLHTLITTGSMEKQCLALHLASQLQAPEIELPLYLAASESTHVQVWAFLGYQLYDAVQGNPKPAGLTDSVQDKLFKQCYELVEKIEVKEKGFSGKVFSWLHAHFDKDYIYKILVSCIGDDVDKFATVMSLVDGMTLGARGTLAEQVLGPFYGYSYKKRKGKKVTLTEAQRVCAMALITDRAEYVHTASERALASTQLTDDELESMETMLSKKSTGLQKRLINVLMKQPEKRLVAFTQKLMGSDNTNQRVAALELAWQLNGIEKHQKTVSQWLADYKGRSKFTKAETQLLDRFENSGDSLKVNALSQENGWGMYDPSILSTYAEPTLKKSSVFAKYTKKTKLFSKKNKYGFSKPVKTLKSDLKTLMALFDKHKDHEYERTYWDSSVETSILGNNFASTASHDSYEKLNNREKFESYPLWEVWEGWYKDVGWHPRDLFIMTLVQGLDNEKKWGSFLKEYIFIASEHLPNPSKNHWNNPIFDILHALTLAAPFTEKNAFLIGATQNLFANLPSKVLQFTLSEKDEHTYYYHNRDKGNGWQSQSDFFHFLSAVSIAELSDDEFSEFWYLQRWQQHSGLAKNIAQSQPSLHGYARAYQQKLIRKDELIAGILLNDNAIADIQGRSGRYYKQEKWIANYPFLQEVVTEINNYCLDIELKRGELETPVSEFVQRIQRLEGIERLVALVSGLGKKGFYANYIYGWGDMSKRELFSQLTKSCYPRKTETQADFDAAMADAKLDEAKLVAVAMYAPQWQVFISTHLDWQGLDSGLWWMRAHTKTSDYEERNAEDESEIARFSTIDIADFKLGAVDIDWFTSAYAKLGKKRWEMLYDCAKYVSDGNGHRRAKLYSDVLTNQLKIREVTAKVKDKRDKDYVRLYGLVPLSKTRPEKDVLSRYHYLQQFKKESRQFGSQRQASEGQAVQVAMDNLARNAGYPDPIRLSWAMESKTVQEIFAKNTQLTFDETTISLVIGQDGKAKLDVEKAGKKLKSVPAKYKKDKAVVELNKQKKLLVEQFRRSRKSLEEAMVRGDEFTVTELNELFEHPVIAKHLEKLVFVSQDGKTLHTGFYQTAGEQGQLVDAAGKKVKLKPDARVRIAHCTDLHATRVWTDYQHYCFDNELVQPFKQVFRELYVPTPDELAEKSVSKRYAGHQVQPAKTVALLKGRGWRVDYDEGLQKVYHQQGFTVKLYAMADWFSPADTESPTLETLCFESLTDGKNVAFTDIDARTFSEVMRDVDLVVSVAHVGGVDPEASQSSIEMRGVILSESMRLFKLDNVDVKGKHAHITGSLASYSVHLGSAVVHQVPGKYLSILPVHSQHRGRIFLPFMDDDPKTAELISKVLLLARDGDIQDPTVLKQIEMK